MLEFSLSDLLKRIKLSDIFGSSGVSFGPKISKGKLGRVSLCDIFNRIFKEAKLLEEDEDVCEIIPEQSGRSLFDLLKFDICAISLIPCGKKDLVDLVQGLDLRNIRFPGGVKLTMGEIVDRLSGVLNVKLSSIRVPVQSNELSNSSRTLSIMGIPIVLSVKIDLSYRMQVEGMGNPKRGFWMIAGMQGGAGYIGAVAVREFEDLLRGEMRPPRGGQLEGPGGEPFPQNPTFAEYTMEWDVLLAQLSGGNPTPLAGLAVISRCDEWTQFLKSRLIVGAGLKPDEAIGIKEAFFNEGYYQLLRVGIGNHPIDTMRFDNQPFFTDAFKRKYHAQFSNVAPFSGGKVIDFPRGSTSRACVYITGERNLGDNYDPHPDEVSYTEDNQTIQVGKKVILKICSAPSNTPIGSPCSCSTDWFTKTLYCMGDSCSPCIEGDCPGGIVGVEFCGGFRAGPVYRPGILRIQDSFLRLRIIPAASVAKDIFSFVLPLFGGPTITIGIQADAYAPIVAEVTLDSINQDIDVPSNYPNSPAQFSGPLYEIPDIPGPLAECTLVGNATLSADLTVDPKLVMRIGVQIGDGRVKFSLPSLKIPLLRVDFFDYLPLSWVKALRRFGIYRVGDCRPGMRHFGDCQLAGFYNCYEFCDHKDNDKDGVVDNNTGKTFSFLVGIANECPMVSGLIKYLETEEYYIDNDGDGFGAEPAKYACTWMEGVPPNAVQVGGDCDDRDPKINPMAQEICDCKDNNCNGQIDEGYNGRKIYRDCDGDGFGNYAITITNCCGLPELPPGCRWVERGGDCDDDNCNINPIVIDNPGDGIDANCDGQDGMVRICFLRGDKLVCYGDDTPLQPPQEIQGVGDSQPQPYPTAAPKLNTIKKLESFIKKLISFIFLPQPAYGYERICEEIPCGDREERPPGGGGSGGGVQACDCNYCQANPNANCRSGSGVARCMDWINGRCPCTCQLCNRFSNISCRLNDSQVSCSSFANKQCGGMCSFLVLCPDKDKDGFQDFNKSITIGYYGSGEIQLPDQLKDYTTCSCHDCDDTDPSIPYPGIEVIDGKDNDCNGAVDDVGPK
ncbi:MAG: putative metal-binding motif-containing protein, partial [Candidatus Calescibacterium sp.]